MNQCDGSTIEGWSGSILGLEEGRIGESFTEELTFELDLKNKESSSIQSRRRRSEKEVSWSRGLEADKRAGSRKVWYLA